MTYRVGKQTTKKKTNRPIRLMTHLMEAEVALYAVGCEENFALACQDKQKAVQRLKHNRLEFRVK